MQISNTPLFDVYPPAPATDSRRSDRLPVTIDAGAEYTPVVSSQRADNTSVVLAAERQYQGQQARFVRDFISAERQLGDPASLPQLPRAVEQYLTVADLGNRQPAQRLLDEIV